VSFIKTTQTPATTEKKNMTRIRFSQIFDTGSEKNNTAGVGPDTADPGSPLVTMRCILQVEIA